MEGVFPILFGVLIFSVLVWFFLCTRLFRSLAARHPEKYESMGKPSLIMNNSPSSNIAFMKFLFRGEWRALGDPGLSSLSRLMVVLFVAYSLLLLVMMALAVSGYTN